jgi:hypothetical protein
MYNTEYNYSRILILVWNNTKDQMVISFPLSSSKKKVWDCFVTATDTCTTIYEVHNLLQRKPEAFIERVKK